MDSLPQVLILVRYWYRIELDWLWRTRVQIAVGTEASATIQALQMEDVSTIESHNPDQALVEGMLTDGTTQVHFSFRVIQSGNIKRGL